MHAPTNEKVAIGWLRTLDGLPATAINTTLPDDETKWPTGFVQVRTVGGVTSMDVPQRRPIVQLDFWVSNPRSAKPPWGRANALAEVAYQACYQHSNLVRVQLGGEFADAEVQSAFPMSEPQRQLSDVARYARYSFDLEIVWRAVS